MFQKSTNMAEIDINDLFKPANLAKIQKELDQRQNERMEVFENQINTMDKPVLELIDEYNYMRIQGQTDQFYVKMMGLLDDGTIKPELARQIIENVHSQLPDLSSHVQQEIAQANLIILKEPRKVELHALSRKHGTFLSLYSFDTNDQSPFYDIEVLYKKVTSELQRIGHPWGYLHSSTFPGIVNPVSSTPETLDIVACQRIELWYEAFEAFRRFRDKLDKDDLADIKQYDIFLFPERVQTLDSSFMGRVWKMVVSNPTEWLRQKIFQNRLSIFIFQTVMCMGIMIIFSMWCGFDANMLKMFIYTLLSNALAHMVARLTQLVIDLKWSLPRVKIELSMFGSLGALLFTVWNVFPSLLPTQLQTLTYQDIYNLVCVLLNGAWGVGVAVINLGTGGTWQEVLIAMGWDTIVKTLRAACKSVLHTIISQRMLPLTGLLTVHATRYLCALMGWTNDDHQNKSKCEMFADSMSWVVKQTGLAILMWNLFCDLRLLWRLKYEKAVDWDLRKSIEGLSDLPGGSCLAIFTS